MRFVIGGFFSKRDYEIRQRSFSSKEVMKFVIGGCFDKRVYEICQKRRGPKIGTIK